MPSSPPQKRLLLASYFGKPVAGGGPQLTNEIVLEWLGRGDRIHVLSAHGSGELSGPFKEALDLGLLQLSQITEPSLLARSHRISPQAEREALSIHREFQPDTVHVHNFQGLLSAAAALSSVAKKLVYLPLDFGMICPNSYLFDGSTTACSGSAPGKCGACMLRWDRQAWSDLPGLLIDVLTHPREPQARGELRRWSDRSWRHYLGVQTEHALPLMKHFLSQVHAMAVSTDYTASRLTPFASQARIKRLDFPIAETKIAAQTSRGLARKPGPLRLLFIGHAHPIKGLPFLLKEVLPSLGPETELEIWDAGHNTRTIRSYPKAIQRFFKLTHELPSTALKDLFPAVDATLIPSLWSENAPLAAGESLANGTPVLGHDIPGIGYGVKNGVNSLLLPIGDANAWIRLLSDPSSQLERLSRMRANCHYDVRKREYVDQLDELERMC